MQEMGNRRDLTCLDGETTEAEERVAVVHRRRYSQEVVIVVLAGLGGWWWRVESVGCRVV